MVKIQTFLLMMLLTTFCSGQALAYQYRYFSPAPYSAAHAYQQAYVPAAYPYYPGYRYPARPAYSRMRLPVRAPGTGNAGINTEQQGVADASSSRVEAPTGLADKAVKSASGSDNKKQRFISTLLPYIEKENRRLTALRNHVAAIFSRLDSNTVSASEKQHISKLAKKYRVHGDPLEDQAAREELLRKIDIIPASLALAQAANESAWGESRFAQEANNLFGIWTYDQDKGLKPKEREQGKTHLVRIFDDVGESVQYYMHTLNSHPAYAELREIRQQLRSTGQVIEGHQLAAGLEKYSSAGEAYISLIRNLIRQNDWALLDTGIQRV